MDKKVGDVVGYDEKKAEVELIEDLKRGDKIYINKDKTKEKRNVGILNVVKDAKVGDKVKFEVKEEVEIGDEVFLVPDGGENNGDEPNDGGNKNGGCTS